LFFLALKFTENDAKSIADTKAIISRGNVNGADQRRKATATAWTSRAAMAKQNARASVA